MRRHLIFLSLLFFAAALMPAQDSAASMDNAHFDPKSMRPPVPLETPPAALPAGAPSEGICTIAIIVDKQGNPQEPRILRCTNPIFGPNALAAVMNYRFKPAMRDKDAVAVRINIEIRFANLSKAYPFVSTVPFKVQLEFQTPPGVTSAEPDAKGIYPLTQQFSGANDLPHVVKLSGTKFAEEAAKFPSAVGCNVLLTIDAKGKPADAKALNCDEQTLEKAAVDALMRSHYKPAVLRGNAVAVRALVRLVYQGFEKKP